MKNIRENTRDYMPIIIIELFFLVMVSKENQVSSVNYVDLMMNVITLPLYIYIIIIPVWLLITLKKLSRVNKVIGLIRNTSMKSFWNQCMGIIIKSNIIYTLIYHVPMFLLCRIMSKNMGTNKEWIVFAAELCVFLCIFTILGMLIQLLCFKFGTSSRVVLTILGLVYLFSIAARIFPNVIPRVLTIENLMMLNIIQFQGENLVGNILSLCIYMLIIVGIFLTICKRVIKRIDIFWR